MPLYVFGDLNIDFHSPRDAEEERMKDALSVFLQRTHSTVLASDIPTRVGFRSASFVDVVAVPTDESWQWHADLALLPRFSDHAAIAVTTSHCHCGGLVG